jgi:hypothetical protein
MNSEAATVSDGLISISTSLEGTRLFVFDKSTIVNTFPPLLFDFPVITTHVTSLEQPRASHKHAVSSSMNTARHPRSSSDTSMSSSSSPYTRPRATTGLVGTEARDYQNSPLKPAPLRIPSKTRPSTPKLISRLSQSQRDGQSTPPTQYTEVRTTTTSLAGLVSKFEILGAMNNVGGKAPVPPPHRTLEVTTPSADVSPPVHSPVDMPEVAGARHHLARKPSSGSISPLSQGSHSVWE